MSLFLSGTFAANQLEHEVGKGTHQGEIVQMQYRLG
jgi:hypothetical protein